MFDIFVAGRRKIVMLFLLCTMGTAVILAAGLRWDTGTDWSTYRYYFVSIESRNWGSSGMEIGYEILVRFFHYFFNGEQTPFLLFTAFAIVTITYTALFKASKFPLFSLFLLMSYSLVGSGFGVRQDLAIALIVFSITYIEQRSFIKFVAIMLLAFAIHKSSAIFFPAYYLYTFRWSAVKISTIILFTVLCVALSETLMQTLGSLVSENKAEHYLELGMDHFDNPVMSMIKGLAGRFLLLLVGIGFVKYGENEDKFYNGLFNLYVFGIIIYSIFTPLNLIFSRLARPYDVFQILLIPLAYSKASRTYKIIILFVIISFSVLKFSTTLKNSDEGVYVPYKSIFTQ